MKKLKRSTIRNQMDIIKMSKGTQFYGGVLSPEDIHEFDALDEILDNVADVNGTPQFSNLSLLNRKTALMMKGNAILKERNDRYAEMLKQMTTEIVSGFKDEAVVTFNEYINHKIHDILARS